jgi:hypothetical protein
LFRLALQLGYAHPDHLTAQLTARQLNEWKAFASLEPIGEYRQELRHGQMMHLLHSAHFKADREIKPVDFMNFFDPPPEKKLTPEEIESALTGIFGA